MSQHLAQFKEMIIRKPKPYRGLRLELQGKWLNDFGFSIGSMVNVHFQNGCLTLSTDPAAGNNVGVLLVNGKRVRGRTRPHLLIDEFIIRRLTSRIYERVGLTLTPNTIQISVINQYTTKD